MDTGPAARASRRTAPRLWLILAGAAIAAHVLIITPAHGAGGGALISLDVDPSAPGVQSIASVAQGTDIPIDVVVLGAPPLGAFEFEFVYDSSVLDFKGWSLGAFLGSTGRKPACTELITQHSVRVGCVTWGPWPAGPSGDGVLAKIVFRHILSGKVCPVLIDAGTADVDGNTIATTRQQGCVTVVPQSPGDSGTASSTATATAAQGPPLAPVPTATATPIESTRLTPTWTPSPDVASPPAVTPAATAAPVSGGPPPPSSTPSGGSISPTREASTASGESRASAHAADPSVDQPADVGEWTAADPALPADRSPRRNTTTEPPGELGTVSEFAGTGQGDSVSDAITGRGLLPASSGDTAQRRAGEHPLGTEPDDDSTGWPALTAIAVAGLLALGAVAGGAHEIRRRR